MSPLVSRRDALRALSLALSASELIHPWRQVYAAELPHVSSVDPMASALGYHEDVQKIDAKQFPTYGPGQTCSNCLQIQGTVGQPWRPCSIFPGKLVSSSGWCKVYVKKA